MAGQSASSGGGAERLIAAEKGRKRSLSKGVTPPGVKFNAPGMIESFLKDNGGRQSTFNLEGATYNRTQVNDTIATCWALIQLLALFAILILMLFDGSPRAPTYDRATHSGVTTNRKPLSDEFPAKFNGVSVLQF